jgi:hypothetical protein
MIHTDGTPTIANAPRREPVAVPEVAIVAAEGRQLLERSYAGLAVEVIWNGKEETCYLIVRKGGESVGFCEVPREKVQDAFDHPYSYLDAAGVSFDA